jgi:hypothetical protein
MKCWVGWRRGGVYDSSCRYSTYIVDILYKTEYMYYSIDYGIRSGI